MGATVRQDLFNKWGGVTAAIALLSSWLLYWNYSMQPVFSFFAAAMTAGMAWMAHVFIRLIILTIKR